MPIQRERWIVRDFYDTENMADEVKKLKNLRKNKLAAFTRKHTQLSGLIDNDEVSAAKLTEVFAELKAAFAAVENAHDNYSCVVDEAVLDAEEDYLGTPSDNLNSMDLKVLARIQAIRDAEGVSAHRKRIDSGRLKLKNSITNFGSPSKAMTEWSRENHVVRTI